MDATNETAGARPAPAGAPPPPEPARPPPWRRRHPVLARTLLYGVSAVLAVGVVVLLLRRRAEDEERRQHGLLTTLDGLHQMVAGLAPELALEKVRSDVLGQRPDDATRLEARLVVASLLDRLARYDAAEAEYASLDRDWPASHLRGRLLVPWANMRVSAGRAAQARTLLERPGATEGFPDADVATVRARIDAATRGAGAPPESGPGR